MLAGQYVFRMLSAFFIASFMLGKTPTFVQSVTNNWSPLGTKPLNGNVRGIALVGTNVYAIGDFTNAGGDPNADYIAKWNGITWSALGSGLNAAVNAIAVSGTDVYVGGYFTDAGGNTNADGIAKWDGTAWSALDTGLNDVYALAVDGTDVYAGGFFTNAGGDPNQNYIAKWDGSTWSGLGTGLDDTVTAIAINGNNVYVGGYFTNAGGDPNQDYIAKWDGSTWSALGGGLNGFVDALTVIGTDVYAAGHFLRPGTESVVEHIRKWDGSSWSMLGTDLLKGGVNCLATDGTNLYAGGSFTNAGGDAKADYIAKWDGSQWAALGETPLNNGVLIVAINGVNIYAGGIFTNAGGDAKADYIARFGPTTRKALTAIASQDGWVLESSETSGVGSWLNSGATTFRLGDDVANKQYRGILSFKTSIISDTAVITSVTLKVRKQTIVGGGNPVTAFQGFMVDIKKGFFGTTVLQTSDFQAAANKTYGPFMPTPSSGWYKINLTTGKAYINKLSTKSGLTQIRLRFKLDDNNNTIANYLSLYSGNATTANRPQLVIKYYVP